MHVNSSPEKGAKESNNKNQKEERKIKADCKKIIGRGFQGGRGEEVVTVKMALE